MIDIEFVGGPYDGWQSIIVVALGKKLDDSLQYFDCTTNGVHYYTQSTKKTKDGRLIYKYCGVRKSNPSYPISIRPI